MGRDALMMATPHIKLPHRGRPDWRRFLCGVGLDAASMAQGSTGDDKETDRKEGVEDATLSYAFSPTEAQAVKVQRAELGTLMLFLGMLTVWAPLVAVVGVALLLVGSFLVIMGDEVFGAAHSRKGLVAGVLLLLGIMGTLAAVRNLREVLLEAQPEEQAAIFANYLVLVVFFLVLVGVAELLVTYELQPALGRQILWAGLFAWMAFLAFTAYELRMTTAALAALGATPTSLRLEVLPFMALRAGPALLYAAAYFLAWSRIRRGSLPAAALPAEEAG